MGLGLDLISGEAQMGSATGINAVPVTMGANSTLDLNSFSVTASSLNAAAAATTAVITNNGAFGTSSTLTVTGGGTYNGLITNGASGGVTSLQSTAGTLILTNLASTYTGGTVITGGTVEAGNGTTPTSGFAPYADNILGVGPVSVTNATLELNSQATASAAIGLQFNFSNSITLNGNATLLSAAGINSLNGPVTINGTGNAINVTLAQMPLEIQGNLSGSGTVTISGVSNTNPPKNVELYGDGSNFTGSVILNASAAQLFIGNINALKSASLTINGNYVATNDTADIYYPNNVGSALVFSPTEGINSPSIGSINSQHPGDGNIILATSDGQFGVNLSIGNNNGNSNLSGIVSDVPTSVGAVSLGGVITKIGSGSLTLSGANTFTGGVVINSGTLVAAYTTASATASSTGTGTVFLNGGVLASAAGVQSYVLGTVVGGSATAHSIAPGGVGTIGSLNIGGLITTNLTTLAFDLGSGSGEVTNGDLLTIGAGTVSVGSGTMLAFSGTPVSGADYRLISAPINGGLVGGINDANLILPAAPAGESYSLSNNGVDPGFIDLIVQGTGPASLTWTDGSNDHLWNGTSANWTGGAAYSDGANVTFDDTAGVGHFGVMLNGTVNPGSIVINNNIGSYSITGTGGIGGTGSLSKSGVGTVTLSTANSYTGGTFVTGGTVVITPTSPTTSALPNGLLAITGTGIVQLASNVTLGSQSGSTPMSNVNISSLLISGTGTLDISNNHIIVQYTPGNDPIVSIAQWIASGYAGGTWNGDGIISSAAAGNSSYGIGFADAADPGNPAGLATGQIEIMYTLLGDANLDGKVNGADFAILATNFNKAASSASSWDQGDFNYDGKINGADFAALATNFNKGASQSATAGADLAVVNSYIGATDLTASVPEPASGGLAVAAILGGLARRQRRSRT
jgi:autotransporter-associated beta strand protein